MDLLHFLITQKNKKPFILLISVLIIFGLSVKFSWDIMYVNDALRNSSKNAMDVKWYITENFLRDKLILNDELASYLGNKIVAEARKYDDKTLVDVLSSIGTTDEENVLLTIIENNLRNVYFLNIESPKNNPFALIIGKDKKDDSYLIVDFAENGLPSDKISIILEEEVLRRTSSPRLVEWAINRILDVTPGDTINDLIFLRMSNDTDFEHPNENEVESFDIRGLRELFYKNNGDFDKTFNGIEILTPFYIYKHNDIVGNIRIKSGIRTDVKIIAIVSGFSPYVIAHHTKDIISQFESIDRNNVYMEAVLVEKSHVMLLIDVLIIVINTLLTFILYIYISLNKEKMIMSLKNNGDQDGGVN